MRSPGSGSAIHTSKTCQALESPVPVSTAYCLLIAASLLHRNEVTLGGPGVALLWTEDPILGIHRAFLPLRQPAGEAAHGEEDGEHLGRESERPIDDSGVEVDIGIQLPLDEVIV